KTAPIVSHNEKCVAYEDPITSTLCLYSLESNSLLHAVPVPQGDPNWRSIAFSGDDSKVLLHDQKVLQTTFVNVAKGPSKSLDAKVYENLLPQDPTHALIYQDKKYWWTPLDAPGKRVFVSNFIDCISRDCKVAYSFKPLTAIEIATGSVLWKKDFSGEMSD